MPEFTIAGKRVTLRERFPASEFWDMPKLISDLVGEGTDYEKHIPLLLRLIESWEFDGDPTDPEAYGELDILRELRPLIRASSDYVAEMVSGEGD